jgi:hypothetical protein
VQVVWFDCGPVMCVWQFAPELKMQPWYAVRLVAASPVHVGDASACGATPESAGSRQRPTVPTEFA